MNNKTERPLKDFRGFEMCDACWNGHHFPVRDKDGILNGGCNGWMRSGRKVDGKDELVTCTCPHHDSEPRRKKQKPDPTKQMDIMETGCGTIEIK